VCNPGEGRCLPWVSEECGDGPACEHGFACDEELRLCAPAGCADDRDCADAYLCDAATQRCMPDARPLCGVLPPCEHGFVCDEQAGVCDPASCHGDRDCAEGWLCGAAPGVCAPDVRPACGALPPCDHGFACDEDAELCVPAPCAAAEDCASGYLCDGQTLRCTPDVAPTCGDGPACEHGFVCDPDPGPGQCVPGGCGDDRDCAEAWLCTDGTCAPDVRPVCGDGPPCEHGFVCDDGQGACVPAACHGDRDCAADHLCDGETGLCAPDERPGCGALPPCGHGFTCQAEACQPAGCDDDLDCAPAFSCAGAVCTADAP